MANPPPRISAVIPIYGNVGDLNRLIAALNGQTLKPWEIILVDSSPKPLENPPRGGNVRYVKNPNEVALSWDYNLGLKENTGDYQLDLQQDCLPEDPQALERLFRHLDQPGRVAAVALVMLPKEAYAKYDFWGQVLMARWVGRVQQGISGKFDLIRKDVFQKIGGYDTRNFSFAGEDMDLFLRLSQEGEVFVASDVEIIHYHQQGRRISCLAFFKKYYQLAESFGALLRRWGWRLRAIPYSGHWTHHLGKYLYPAVLLIPFWPGPVCLALFVLTQFINIEAWKIKSWKTPLLLLVNPVLFLAVFWATVSGFISGKQRFSVNK
ncbi:MAG: glycosyltransferase [Verrucomicrobiota bacterium]|jgi:GT2 family glycosyltransferase